MTSITTAISVEVRTLKVYQLWRVTLEKPRLCRLREESKVSLPPSRPLDMSTTTRKMRDVRVKSMTGCPQLTSKVMAKQVLMISMATDCH